jgi:arylsulfatase A-like enzyme
MAVPMVEPRQPRARDVQGSGKPNVIIYLVDALRADRLSSYGHSRPTSPGLDEFARRATLYERAYAQSSWTRPAVASLFTGLRPEVHGANRRRDRLARGPATLAERLSRAGYQTAALVANPNVAAEFGFDRGFDHYALSPVDGRRSIDLHRRVVEWLDRRRPDRPFFLYIHAVDPHLPYDPPPEFRRRFAAGVERDDLGSTESVGKLLARDLENESGLSGDLLDLYDAEVASNDQSFAALLDELERRGLVTGSMIVFLSDHGEEFFDHGGWIHGRTLYREMIHTPLVISYPGQKQGRREMAPVQHVDLFPTVLEVAGVDAGSSVHGMSLLGGSPAERAISAFLDHDGWQGLSVVRGRWKAVRHGNGGYVGRPELYEVEHDPHELDDRGAELGVLAGTLLSESSEEVIDEEGMYEAEAAEIDEELRERLKALGYI